MTQRRDKRTPPNGGEKLWRWAVRIVGLGGFITLLALFAAGREVPVVWLVVVGGMMGLEQVVDWQLGRK